MQQGSCSYKTLVYLQVRGYNTADCGLALAFTLLLMCTTSSRRVPSLHSGPLWPPLVPSFLDIYGLVREGGQSSGGGETP